MSESFKCETCADQGKLYQLAWVGGPPIDWIPCPDCSGEAGTADKEARAVND